MNNKNSEGVTWDEWARAAKLPFRPSPEIVLPAPHYSAWKMGEDPTEWESQPVLFWLPNEGTK